MSKDGAPDRGCALVTGASGGVGAAIAGGLAADGWAVGVGFRTGEKHADSVVEAIRAGGGEALAVEGDIREPDTAEALCTRVEAEFGRPLTVLVNNAGVTAYGLSALTDDETWRTVLETNLSAAFRLTRRALKPMIRAGFGRIVNVTSAVSERPTAGQAGYVASKAGLVGLTKATAVEVASRSITVNAISPGLIDTAMAGAAPADLAASVPAGRLGEPAEVAACARFLVSEAASYVTGSVLTVDGGLGA